jgi:glutamyl-tRNA synthetase
LTIDAKAAQKFFTPDIKAPLSRMIEKLDALEEFSESAIETAFAQVLHEFELPMGKLAQPMRVALTGTSVSPGIHEVIAVLGKARTLSRLRSALERIA